MTPEEFELIVRIIKIIGELILAFIAGVGGFLVSKKISTSTIKKQESEANKQDSDAAKELTNTALMLMKPLREEVQRLSERLDVTNRDLQLTQRELHTTQERLDRNVKRLKLFEGGVRILICQLENLHIIPEWIPPEEDENINEQSGNPTSNKSTSGKRT
jgi:TolA-binding protein